MPSDSQIIERIHLIDKQQEIASGRINTLEAGAKELWADLKEIGKMVGNIRVQVAAIVAIGGVLQVLATAWVVYKITKGG